MAILDRVQNSLQRLFFGKSFQDCENELRAERRKNAILRKELKNLDDRLKQEKAKTQKLRSRLSKLSQRNSKLNQVLENKAQDVNFKIYFSVLGVSGSTAGFEIDCSARLDVKLSQQEIERTFSSDSFFDSLMSLYDMQGAIDSSLLQGDGKISGFQSKIVDGVEQPTILVNFQIKDNPKSNDVGSLKISNPLFGVYK